MNNKKTKIVLFVWLAIFIVLTSLVVFEFINLKNENESVQTLEQDIIQERDSLQAFEILVKSASNIKGDTEKANVFFIKRDEVVNFLDTIESLAFTTNTKVSIQSVNDKGETPNNKILSVEVHAQGTYSNLYYLLRMLENLPFQTEIQNVRLSKSGSSSDGKESFPWSADINIVGVMF